MKNKFLLGAVLFMGCTFTMNVQAQLSVEETGEVIIDNYLEVKKEMAIGSTSVDSLIGLNIDKTTNSSYSTQYGIRSYIRTNGNTPTSSIYGIHSVADASPSPLMTSGNKIVGVYGIGVRHSNVSNFAAGVAGFTYYYGGVGVYGGIAYSQNPLPSTISGCYAGYFNGTVNVNGTLFATAISTTSDLRQKENIKEIESTVSDDIQLLNPVSYTLKQDSVWRYDKEATELQGVHYGLIAQDVQRLFPELVYERNGMLSINYIELIPLLIKKVQELSVRVDELETQQMNK